MNAIGLNPATGRSLSGDDHLRRSIACILTTPRGSRIARRTFGSLLPELIDQPLNGKTRMQAMAASVMALAEWEPRIELSRVLLNVGTGDQAGRLTIDIQAKRRDSGQHLAYSIPVRG
ncbi:GPW/gp25 family protein [Chromobacterium amazonense]|uniref:GPW/gp25 family protein n=1 Tax=Chromobacterium amazonense TaxID=1382803 RepID=A0ABU8V408_9NEIS|nr:GPW/gp25 family protein [Chromobacterium amazonense]MDQ4541084.1 GPW/gp25 family protein [Chromobacterium amazonense]